jgi:hypothetical protein
MKRFLSLSDIEAAVEVLRVAGQPFAVVGGMAMAVHGSDRMTADLDVIARSTVGHAGTWLSFGGVRTTICGVPVDIIVRDDDFADLYEEALDYARLLKGFDARVVTPSYLVPMKMVAGREKDHIDLMFLLAPSWLDTDTAEHTRRIVKRFLGAYGAKSFDALVVEAAWKAERGGK